MNKLLFFDMDGTLARFYEKPNYLEKMYEKGFFFELKPYKWVQELNKDANRIDWESIYIISACVDTPNCRIEKLAWLRTYLPHLCPENILLCDVGENKAEIIANQLGDMVDDCECWLIDDYSRNIYEWVIEHPNFHAIKFVNGINNKSGRNYGCVARNWDSIKTKSGFETIS